MTDELKHYGVLGMKWGVHKARSYAADRNNYIRKQKNKEAFKRLRSGEIDRYQYARARIKNRKAMDRKNQKVIDATSGLTPKKGEKISSIYKKYKDQAINTIPHYKLKKGAKKTASLLISLGTSPITVNWKAMSIGLDFGAKSVAKNFISKQATNAFDNAVTAGVTQYLQDKKSKKRKEASKK